MKGVFTGKDGKKYFSLLYLYDERLKLNRSNYSKNIKKWFNQEFLFKGERSLRKPILNKDYFTNSYHSTSYKSKRKDYLLTSEFSKLIALDSKSKFRNEYIQWLLSLEDKVEDGKLISIDLAAFSLQVIDYFRYTNNQKKVIEQHRKSYAKKNKIRRGSHAIFQDWRNTMLGIQPETVERLLADYCVRNGRSAYLNKKSKFVKLFTMDNYLTLKHAVWDWLNSENMEDLADKISKVVYDIAKKANIEILTVNEDNLFQVKESNYLPTPTRKLLTN